MSNVRNFGARGDGVNDDTGAILRAIENGDGALTFPRGDYRITRTVTVELARTGRFGIDGAAGTAKIVMAGPGPAFHLIGTHEGTALPASFKPGVWDGERMPTVLNIEVEGRHPEADGFLIMPIPHGVRGAVQLRLDKLFPGMAPRTAEVEALDRARKRLATASATRRGPVLGLDADRAKAWYYRVTMR